MAPPSQLSIATASVIRLLKEETSYRTELEGQRKRLQILQAAESGEDEDGNRAWNIGQQACALHEHRLYQKPHWKANRRKHGQGRAIQETEAVFGPLREKISTALEALESLLQASEEGRGDGSSEDDLDKARSAIEKAKSTASA